MSGFVPRGLYLDLPAWGYHAFEVSREQVPPPR